MTRYKIPVLRSVYEYGYYVIEAENKNEAMNKAKNLFQEEDPDNMEPIGAPCSEMLEDEIEEITYE